MKVSNLLMLFVVAIGIFSMSACKKDKELAPTAEITQITVKSYPRYSSGSNTWDLTTNADLYPTLHLGQSSTSPKMYDSPTYITDASPSASHSFNGGMPISIFTNSEYSIFLWDLDDLDADDLIGGIRFTPKDYHVADLTSQTINLIGGNISIDVTINWTYQ